MLKHIVMWRLRDDADVQEIKQALDALWGVVPSLRGLETGINRLTGEHAPELVLLTAFDDAEGLEQYRTHPAHQAVIPLLQDAAIERRVVDYVL